MSLINQMLKDLAERSYPSVKPEGILPHLFRIKYLKPQIYRVERWLIAGAFFLMLTVISVIVQQLFFTSNALPLNSSNELSYQTAAIHSQSLQSIPGIAESPSSSPPVLTGISIQVQKDMTHLRLLLSQNALYQVKMEGKYRLIFVLEHTRLIASLPPINTINSAIKAIQMLNQTDGNLKIILTLNSGAELKHLELNTVGKLPELQIDLSDQNPLNLDSQSLSQAESVEEHQTGSIKKINPDVSMNDEYNQAMQFSTQGRNNEAIILLTELLGKDPEFTAARRSLATILLSQGNSDKAAHIIKIGLQQRPLYPPYVQLKAQILVEEGKIKQALNLLQMAPPTLNDNPDYHAFIAALYQRQGQSMLAEKLYEQLLKIQPDNSIWWMGLGIARESMNKKNAALEAFTSASNTDNLSPELKAYVDTRMHTLDERG